jgi:putative ABC transport system permease protein
MRTLDRKLLRELRRHWVQITSIALVMGCGTMTIMGLRGTLASIRDARDVYYDAYRFTDLFAHVERAPSTLAARLSGVPGVAALETRIVRDVRLDVASLPEPAIGHMVSIPEARRPMLNDLLVRRGHWPAAGAIDEVLVSERFAELNHLAPGDRIAAVINGRWQRLAIAGIAISPEFVVEQASSAVFVDSRRYGIVWASRRMMESAFDMTGAFNDVAIRLAGGARLSAVKQEVDALLRPWGGLPAYDRGDQPAARTLDDEFHQLRTNATFFPLFFLVVAAFLLNVVLSRLVASQRDEIAALKAFGYTDREIGWHYLGFGVAAVVLGAAVGVPAGIWMGAKFTGLYHDYFRFPSIPARVDWGAAGIGIGVSSAFALLGTISGVRRVMRLTPAEALRPESPSRFRPLLLERLGLGRLVGPSARMVLRNVERRPLRTASTIVGAGLAVALLASGRFPYDAFDRMIDVEFRLAQRYDVLVLFTRQTNGDAIAELRHVPGVLDAQGYRATTVRVSRGTAWRNTSIVGVDTPNRLNRLVDVDGREFTLPADGCAITAWLADFLGVARGDTVDVEMTEQGGVHRRVVVAGIFDPMMGQSLYTSRAALNRLLREQDAVSGAYLTVAPSQETRVMARLKALPGVAGAVSRAATIGNIRTQMRDSMVFVLLLITTSACIIALGVVYNSGRIALSERGRELASLRVLGFTTNEVAGMLLGEQAAMLVVALPVGVLLGAAFSLALARGFETERFHFPYVMTLASQIFAMAVVLAAAVFASLIVRRRVRRLDMVTALRTRE